MQVDENVSGDAGAKKVKTEMGAAADAAALPAKKAVAPAKKKTTLKRL